MADLSQQVELQQQLNKALAEANQLLEQQNKSLKQQADLSRQINKNLGNQRIRRNTRDMTSALRDQEDALDETTDQTRELEDALNDAADAQQSASTGFSVLGKAFSVVSGLFSGGVSVIKAVGGGILNIAGSLAKAAFAIFSFPFKLFGALIDMAQSGGGGSPLREAYEEVRETFGDLASGPGKAIVSTFKQIRKSSNSLGGSGLSVRKVFGYGYGGLAALLKDLNELGAAAGDSFHKLQKSLESMAGKAIVFQRGLGASKEEFTELMSIAESRGQNVEKYLTKFSKTAVLTAKRFGIGVKDMAKGMKELSLDVESFGHLGPKAFAPITAYARKLGLEIKDMAGVMSKFAGFTDTAEAASKMSQAFGMNVDTMQLMGAQNPAEKIDILRKAFYATGKDLSKMNYQQRQYLSQLTGLEGKSLDAAFSLSKQGEGYENIKKQTDEANKKQMSQQKVLKELAKGIKRLIPSGSMKKVKGFFDAFVQGFKRGIVRSGEFRGMLRNLRRGLRHMYRLGIQVGKAFVKYFPGVKDMIKAMNEFFDPIRFEIFRRKALPIFKELFQTQDFETFFKKLTGLFKDNFGDGASALGKLGTAFSKFTDALTRIAGKAISKVIEVFLKGLTLLGSLIVDDGSVKGALAAGGDKIAGDASNLMTPTIEMLTKDGSPIDDLKKVGSAIVDKIKAGLGLDGSFNADTFYLYLCKAANYVADNFTEIADKLGAAAVKVLDAAWEWAKSNPGYAAAAILVFNPFGIRSIFLSLVTTLGGGLLKVLGRVFMSPALIMGAARAMGGLWTSIVSRAGPLISSAVSGIGSFLGAGLSRIGGAGGVFGRFGGAAASGAARLGVYGMVAKIGYDTFSRALDILDDPKLKAAGVTTGEALAGGYIEALGLDHMFATESVDEILERVKREGEAFEDRLAKAMTSDAQKFTARNQKFMNKQMTELAEAQRAGDTKRSDQILATLMERQVDQEYYKIMQSDEYKKAIRDSSSKNIHYVIRKYKRMAKERAGDAFDKETVLKKAEEGLAAQEDAEIKAARAKLERMKAQTEIAAAVEALGDVEKKMKTANMKIKNIYQGKLTTYFKEILSKMAAVFNSISTGLKDPAFAAIATDASLDTLKPIANAASFLKLASTSFIGVADSILKLDTKLKKSFKQINNLDVNKFQTNMTTAAKKLAQIPGAILIGLQPLLPKPIKVHPSLGFSGNLMAMYAGVVAEVNKEERKKIVLDALKNLEKFVTPIAQNLALVNKAFKSFQASIRGLPTITKKYTDQIETKMTNAVKGLDNMMYGLYAGLSGGGWAVALGITPTGNIESMRWRAEESATALTKLDGIIMPLNKALKEAVATFKTFIGTASTSLFKSDKAMEKAKAKITKVTEHMVGVIPDFSAIATGGIIKKALKLAAFNKRIEVVTGLMKHTLGSLASMSSGLSETMKTVGSVRGLKRTASAISSFDLVFARYSALADTLSTFKETSTDIANVLTGDKVKETVAAMNTVTKAAKGGKIQVYHNLKDVNLNMVVNVNLSARQVGISVVNTKLGKKGGQVQYVGGSPTKAGFATA